MLNATVLLFGLIIGGFLNVCIDRLPHHKSVNPFRSFCPSCDRSIRFYEKIPILGYLLSMGKCAQCNVPISLRYPAMEFATAIILFILLGKYGLSLEFLVMAFFILLLLLISIIDISSRTIPDVLTISGLSIGFILSFFRKPFFFYQDALYGIFACGGILFVIAFCCLKIFKKEIMELGDIMLLGTIGAFCGLKGALFSLVAGSLLGAIIGMPLMITKSKSAKYAIPFGPFLSFGAVFFMYFGDRFVYGFLRLLSGSMH